MIFIAMGVIYSVEDKAEKKSSDTLIVMASILWLPTLLILLGMLLADICKSRRNKK